MILEAFAGPGGISEALRAVLPDVPSEGIEKDPAACATAQAAGHKRLQADVSTLDLSPWAGRVTGFCAGPPCQSFSPAGKRLGKLDKPRIVAHVERIRQTGDWLPYDRDGWHDPRSPLVLEVLRYALTLRPEWIMLEQVPAVLPLWEMIGNVLRDHGWHVETKVLKAEQYGVPQTRKRAILAARWCPWHEDGAHPERLAELSCPIGQLLPAPTHRPYRKGVPREAGDQSLLPWVSMGDALDAAGSGITAQARNSGPGARRDPRSLDDPSYTIRAQGSGSHPSGVEWVSERPAPTIVGTRRSSDGMLVGRQLADSTDRRDHGGRSGGPGLTSDHLAAVRVSVREAAVLQSYRPGYPWQGSKSAQYRQVGDSAPPVLMAAVLRQLLG